MVISGVPKPDWKQALLEFQRIADLGDNSWLLKVRLLTGRKHQIRAQLAAAGWPICGDRKYGSRQTFSSGIALHSYSLSLTHPTQKTRVSWSAPPPKAWKISGIDLN
jgi:23S rRNA pseudouridine1911/1915/1917 synthase